MLSACASQATASQPLHIAQSLHKENCLPEQTSYHAFYMQHIIMSNQSPCLYLFFPLLLIFARILLLSERENILVYIKGQ